MTTASPAISRKFPSYNQYITNHYQSSKWLWSIRKITALPCSVISITIKTTYHVALAIFVGIPTYPFSQKNRLKTYLFCAVQDLREGGGYFVAFFNDKRGVYIVQKSQHAKAQYQNPPKKISKQPPTPPPQPPSSNSSSPSATPSEIPVPPPLPAAPPSSNSSSGPSTSPEISPPPLPPPKYPVPNKAIPGDPQSRSASSKPSNPIPPSEVDQWRLVKEELSQRLLAREQQRKENPNHPFSSSPKKPFVRRKSTVYDLNNRVSIQELAQDLVQQLHLDSPHRSINPRKTKTPNFPEALDTLPQVGSESPAVDKRMASFAKKLVEGYDQRWQAVQQRFGKSKQTDGYDSD